MLSARFTLLVFLCGYSSQLLSTASVNAAAISHPPQARRSVPNAYQDSSSHSQRFLPWSAHDKRMADNSPTNPFAKFAHAVLSGIKHKMHHQKRSHKSIIIPSNRGGNYVLPHSHSRRGAPLWRVGQAGALPQRRATEEGIPGTIGITSHVDNGNSAGSSDKDAMIASLFLNNMNGTYVLNASDTNKTQVYLSKEPSSTSREHSSSKAGDDTPVVLCIPLFVNSLTYCITFNPNPSLAEPMTMQPYFNPGAADGNSTSSMSQTFLYNPGSGVIRPTWLAGHDDGTRDTTSAQDVPKDSNSTSSAMSAKANANVTESASSAQPTSTNLSAREAFHRNTQNVTLVFIPAGSAASAAAVTDGTAMSSGALQSSTVSASGSMAAASVGLSTDSSSAASPSQSVGGLDVQLVGDGSLPASSSASSGSATSGFRTMTSMPMASSSMPGRFGSAQISASSINAEAVASSVASAWSSSRAAAFRAPASASDAMPSPSASDAMPSPSASDAVFSPSASASMSMSAADASLPTPSSDSASASVSAAIAQPSSSDTQASSSLVAAVFQRNAPRVTPVSTKPYQWKFRAEAR